MRNNGQLARCPTVTLWAAEEAGHSNRGDTVHNDDQVFDAALKRRWVAAALALTLVGGLGVNTPLTAQAAPGDIVIKLPDTTEPPEIVVASGSSQLLKESYDSVNRTYRHFLSTDAGASWNAADINGYLRRRSSHVANGVLTYQGADDKVRRYDLGTNTSTELREFDRGVIAMGPKDALFWDEVEGDFPTGLMTAALTGNQAPRRLNNYTPPRSFRNDVWMAQDAAIVADGEDVDRVPLDGTSAVASVNIPGLSAIEVRGNQVVYLTRTKSGASLCFRSPTQTGSWGSAACTTLVAGDQRHVYTSLSVGNGWVVVSLSNGIDEDLFMVGGTTTPTTPSRIKPPAEVVGLTVYGAGDTDAPLANVATPTGGYVAYYRSNGSFTRIANYETTSSGSSDYELTPGTVLATQGRPTTDTFGYQAWSRSITNGTIGAESLFAPRASSGGLSASGDRTIIRGRSGVHLFDRNRSIRSLPTTDWVSRLSGAYYLADGVRRVQRNPSAQRPGGGYLRLIGPETGQEEHLPGGRCRQYLEDREHCPPTWDPGSRGCKDLGRLDRRRPLAERRDGGLQLSQTRPGSAATREVDFPW
ncbi:MAG: hypothetical protein QM695_13085 [Micropruina sp.]